MEQSHLQAEMSNRHGRRVGALMNQTLSQRRAVISHPLTEEKRAKGATLRDEDRGSPGATK